MATNRNLTPGQYQLGELVMGPGTPFRIEAIDIGNYDVNAQDYQSKRSNELRFGSDTLKPTPLQLTINVMVNRALPHIAALTNDIRTFNFDNDPNLGDLQREWRAEETMSVWGALKPLLFCGTDGITRQFYGRPGKFAYKKHRQEGSLYYQCQGEFRRSDTFAYSDTEYYVDFAPNDAEIITRVNGNATSWMRFLLVGPFSNPIIHLGSKDIQINTTNVYPGGIVPTNEIIEISSYPWERRVVDSHGLSLAAFIVTDKPYLDTIKLPYQTPIEISWSGGNLSGNSRMRVLWHDAYQVMD